MRRIQHTNSHSLSAGFTIVEIAVVVVVIGVVFPVFIQLFMMMYQNSYYLEEKVKKSTESRLALSYIGDTVQTASGFLAVVPSPFSDPYGPHDSGTSGAEAWSYKGDSATSRVLIIKSYATNTNSLANGRQPVYTNTPDFNCTTQMAYQPQLTYVTIYYLKNGTLYRRLLTDKTTALCAGNAQQQKQTCPPYIATGSRNASCEANDEILATQVSAFTTAFYQTSIDGTSVQIDPTFSSSSTTALAAADYSVTSITTSTRGGAVTSTFSQRMTKVNQ